MTGEQMLHYESTDKLPSTGLTEKGSGQAGQTARAAQVSSTKRKTPAK